jgi:LPXTG-motif cell wall-anchored protein
VEAKFSPEATIDFVKIDSISHFEFLENPHIDTANSDGSTIIKGVYKITSFDSGHWVIPSFVLFGSVKTDTIPVDVVFSDFDPNQNYHDIKDIIEVKPSEKKQWWWYVAGAGLLIALLLLYFLRKKKPVAQSIPAAVINPFDEAMKELAQLQQSKTGTKQFHSRLVDIFRLYVYRKKGILSLQKTTDDLVLQLKGMELPKEQFDKLSQSLRLSDFVKFAKYIPVKDDDMICFNEIRNAIITIEKSGGEILPSAGI